LLVPSVDNSAGLSAAFGQQGKGFRGTEVLAIWHFFRLYRGGHFLPAVGAEPVRSTFSEMAQQRVITARTLVDFHTHFPPDSSWDGHEAIAIGFLT
jgi:hypothetical protein